MFITLLIMGYLLLITKPKILKLLLIKILLKQL